MNPVPLYSLLRDGVPEIQIFGEIWVSDGQETLFQSSEVNSEYPARSLLKPFQFLATGLLGFGEREPWHVAALGSISAIQEQRSQLDQWTQKPGSEEAIECLHKSGISSSHSCFSKHLAIMKASQKNGWPLQSYRSQGHPFHKKLTEVLSRLLTDSPEQFRFVIDGCKLPTPVLRMDQLARLFQALAEGTKDPALFEIREMMLQQPDWIGGPDRVDSTLMRDNPRGLVAKEGADGLLAIGVLPNAKFKKGLGLVVKLASGYQPKSAALALKPFLESLGLSFKDKIPEGQNIQYHFKPWQNTRKNFLDISPMLNSQSAVWPGDEGFERKPSLSTDAGDTMTLSAIKTTLHVGAHTDSPSHFGKKRKAIDQVDVWKYQGACQVIEVFKEPHTEIVVEDLRNTEIITPRVLFKTRSFPDHSKFNTDFNSLSASLVEFLSVRHVVLVGIDTPSIDLFESKELPSHKATLRTEMAILEGIDLTHIVPGVYDLVAIPLKIEGGDASPVRALLLNKKAPSEF